MANKMRGEARLGDYTLVYSFNAMCILEEETGLKTGDILVRMQEGVGLLELRSFIWAGLQEKHPEVTITMTGDIIGEAGVETTLAALQKGITAAFDAGQQKQARPRKATKGGTG